MNVQLHHVVSDITGVTGMRIVRAIIEGDRNPEALARLRDVRCKASEETIAAALSGNYQPEHLFALEQAVKLYDFYQLRVQDCDEEILAVLKELNSARQIPDAPLPKPRHRCQGRTVPISWH